MIFMKMTSTTKTAIAAMLAWALIAACRPAVLRAEPPVTSSTVQLNAAGAGPRSVEDLTERTIARDYDAAWKGMAQAFAQGSTAPLNAYFTGSAKTALAKAVKSQQQSGLRSQYTNQSHKLRVIFYAPEGDAMELQDTAEFDFQLMDGDKVVHQEHTVLHYVVLMTPSSDRWLVRRLDSTPEVGEKEVSSAQP